MQHDSKFRVLLADDVANLRALVRVAIELHGPFVVVGEAENGAQAIVGARELEPDLILLDVSMPVLDGIDALPEVIAASPQSKVVIFTSLEEQRVARKAYDAGASGYLEKGIEPELLVRRLTEIMSKAA